MTPDEFILSEVVRAHLAEFGKSFQVLGSDTSFKALLSSDRSLGEYLIAQGNIVEGDIIYVYPGDARSSYQVAKLIDRGHYLILAVKSYQRPTSA